MNRSLLPVGVISLILLLMVSLVVADDTPSSMSVQLKKSNSSQPYEDQSFQERASYAIYNLTKSRPVDNDLMELQSIYYELVKKNISPKYYAEAKNITEFLFYDMKFAEGLQDYADNTGKNHIDMDFKYNIRDQAMTDSDAAIAAWKKIKFQYPNFTPEFT